MSKMKTVKAIRSKFSVTGTGKLRRKKPGLRHLLSGKTSKRKRQLRRTAGISPAQEKMYVRLIGVK